MLYLISERRITSTAHQSREVHLEPGPEAEEIPSAGAQTSPATLGRFTALWSNAAQGKLRLLLWVAASDPWPWRLNQRQPAYAEHPHLTGG